MDEIIQRVLSGDNNAFREIVERYQAAVFALIRPVVRDEALCEDVAQDVFLAAYRSLNRFDAERGRFVTWLLTIARNRALNEAKRRRPVSGEEFEAIDMRTPEWDADRRDAWRQLDRTLQELPIEQRTAFILAELQDLSYEEVSRVENIPLGTVKSRVKRARDKLYAALKSSLGR